MYRSVTSVVKVKVTAARAGLAAVLHWPLVVNWKPPEWSSLYSGIALVAGHPDGTMGLLTVASMRPQYSPRATKVDV